MENKSVNRVDESLPLGDIFDAMVRLGDMNLFVVDFTSQEVIYKSKRLLFVDEASHRDIQRESANPFWALMDSIDLDWMLRAGEAYSRLFDSFSEGEKMNHIAVCDYNIMLNRKHFTVMQKFTPVSLTPEGNIKLGLFSIKPALFCSSKNFVVYGDEFRYVLKPESNEFLPFTEDIDLTQMEKSILIRAWKGYSTGQIAEELFRSKNTIKTHKLRLFEKLHVHSIEEAVLVAYFFNLL